MLHHGIDSHGGPAARERGRGQVEYIINPTKQAAPGDPPAPQASGLNHLHKTGFSKGWMPFRGTDESHGEAWRGLAGQSWPCYFDLKETIFKSYVKQPIPPSGMLWSTSALAWCMGRGRATGQGAAVPCGCPSFPAYRERAVSHVLSPSLSLQAGALVHTGLSHSRVLTPTPSGGKRHGAFAPE